MKIFLLGVPHMIHEALWKVSFVASSLMLHQFPAEGMENSWFLNEDSRFFLTKNYVKL